MLQGLLGMLGIKRDKKDVMILSCMCVNGVIIPLSIAIK